MGGSSSSQKRIGKAQRDEYMMPENINTYNINARHYLESNTNAEASNSDKNPMYPHYPLDYECTSNSRDLQNTNSDVKLLKKNNTKPGQMLPDNSNYYMVASDFQQKMLPKAEKDHSIDEIISNSTLRTQTTGTETSHISNSCIGYTDLSNSNNYSTSSKINENYWLNEMTNEPDNKTENGPTNVGKVGGLKRNSDELDEDKGFSGGESLTSHPLEKSSSNFEKWFDSPVKPQVKRKVPNNHIGQIVSISDNNYSSPITTHSHEHDNLGNSDDKNCAETFSGVKTSDNKVDCDSSFDVLDILSFPEEWTSCALETTGFVDITPESDEGRAVLRLFQKSSVSGSFKLQITNVTRIENPFLHSLYMLKKEEMESRNGNVDELFLYHGTKKENVNQICEDNLNWRLYTDRHRFGRGVSFSPSAIYSSHYSDSSNNRVMFLFKVLVSNSEFGSSDMVIPPIDSDVVFDTSIKDDTSVVVKYSDNEFYPLYKITYNRHSNV